MMDTNMVLLSPERYSRLLRRAALSRRYYQRLTGQRDWQSFDRSLWKKDYEATMAWAGALAELWPWAPGFTSRPVLRDLPQYRPQYRQHYSVHYFTASKQGLYGDC